MGAVVEPLSPFGAADQTPEQVFLGAPALGFAFGDAVTVITSHSGNHNNDNQARSGVGYADSQDHLILDLPQGSLSASQIQEKLWALRDSRDYHGFTDFVQQAFLTHENDPEMVALIADIAGGVLKGMYSSSEKTQLASVLWAHGQDIGFDSASDLVMDALSRGDKNAARSVVHVGVHVALAVGIKLTPEDVMSVMDLENPIGLTDAGVMPNGIAKLYTGGAGDGVIAEMFVAPGRTDDPEGTNIPSLVEAIVASYQTKLLNYEADPWKHHKKQPEFG